MRSERVGEEEWRMDRLPQLDNGRWMGSKPRIPL